MDEFIEIVEKSISLQEELSIAHQDLISRIWIFFGNGRILDIPSMEHIRSLDGYNLELFNQSNQKISPTTDQANKEETEFQFNSPHDVYQVVELTETHEDPKQVQPSDGQSAQSFGTLIGHQHEILQSPPLTTNGLPIMKENRETNFIHAFSLVNRNKQMCSQEIPRMQMNAFLYLTNYCY